MSQSPTNWERFFARNLRTERSRLGITQQDLASDLGMKSGATVTQWEKSTSFPNLETFVKICNYFQKLPTQMLYEDLTGASPPPIKRDDKEAKEMAIGGQQPAAAPEEGKPPKNGKEERLNEMERKFIDLAIELRELRGN